MPDHYPKAPANPSFNPNAVAGAACISVSTNGACDVRALGSLKEDAAETLAKSLILLASRIRRAADKARNQATKH